MSQADKHEGSQFEPHLGCRLCLPELALQGAHSGSLCCRCIMRGTLPLSSRHFKSMHLILRLLLRLSGVSLLGAVKALLHMRLVLRTAATVIWKDPLAAHGQAWGRQHAFGIRWAWQQLQSTSL